MGVVRYVNMAFVATGLIAWVILAEFFGWILNLMGAGVNSQLIGHNFRMADLMGILVAAGVTIYARRDDRVSTFAMEAANELSKVTWPSWAETRLATIVTIIVTVIIAIILEGFDYLWAALSSYVYNV
jgi:preprotein translocase SecE subunit